MKPKMTMVVKRSGEKESFDAEKLKRSIQKAALDAGFSIEKINLDDILKEVNKMAKMKGEMETSEIRLKILNNLVFDRKPIADCWKKFDSKYKLERAPWMAHREFELTEFKRGRN